MKFYFLLFNLLNFELITIGESIQHYEGFFLLPHLFLSYMVFLWILLL